MSSEVSESLSGSDVLSEGEEDGEGGVGLGGRRSLAYGGMTPQAVALLVRADASFKYVAAARQGLEEGGEEWREEFGEAGGWGALERLLLAEGDGGIGMSSAAVVEETLRCMQVALSYDDAMSGYSGVGVVPRDHLVAAVAKCTRSEDECVRGFALEILAGCASGSISGGTKEQHADRNASGGTSRHNGAASLAVVEPPLKLPTNPASQSPH